MRPEKPSGTFRLFLFGESAALGDPRPAYGVGRYLETLLRERVPGVDFEVVTTAMTAINSHAILPIARECARYDGDLWLIYMGNNEMVGPFGPNTVFGAKGLPVLAVRASLALKRTRTGQLFAALARKAAERGAPAAWTGLKMFEHNQLAPDDPRKARVYPAFQRNLEDILRAAERARVPVILSSVAGNLKDCAPFASQHAHKSVGSDLSGWQTRYDAGITNAAQRRYDAAIAQFSEAARRSPQHAELHFRLGECLLASGQSNAAPTLFAAARDFDALPVRADSNINAVIEETAREWRRRGVVYMDANAALGEFSPGGMPGQELFYEHVHLNFEGNYRLAVAFADQVLRQLPPSLTRGDTRPWASPELCARRLGLTDWNRSTAFAEMVERLSDAPFTNQLNHTAMVERLLAEQKSASERQLPDARDEARRIYQEALLGRPDDPWLHHSYAEFLIAIGELQQATDEMTAVRDLLPHHHAAYLQIGRLLIRQKKFVEARRSVEEALRLRPNLPEAYIELGQICAAEGKFDEALAAYDNARQLRPDDPSIHVLRARLFEQRNQRDRAIASLEEALRIKPSSWDARYLLGLQLLLDRQFSQAEACLEAAVRVRPDHAPAHLNLGFALAQQQRFDRAVIHFRETLRLDPENDQARQLLQTAERLVAPRPDP